MLLLCFLVDLKRFRAAFKHLSQLEQVRLILFHDVSTLNSPPVGPPAAPGVPRWLRCCNPALPAR